MNGLTRKVLIFALVMAAVAAGGWLGRKAYKRAIERRLIAEARGCLAKKDWRGGGLCLQRALQVDPMNAEASGLFADLLEEEGSPAALSWRVRAAQLAPGDASHRFAWAKTALELQDFKSATEALQGLRQEDKANAEYHKLAGALAWGLKQHDEAEQHYSKALSLEPNNQTLVLNLATIHLSSTNRAIAERGRLTLQQMTTDAELRVPALRVLEAEALSTKSFATAVDYARRLAEIPSAPPSDQVRYLELLRTTKNPRFNSYLSLLKRDAFTNSSQAFALGQWMAETHNVTNAIQWIRSLPADTQTNAPLPLLTADLLARSNDWQSLLALVESQDWGEFNFHRLAFESLAQTGLKQELAARSAWNKAFRLCYHRLDRLSGLAQIAAAWGWKAQRTEVLTEISDEFPKEKWATALLESQYYADGNSQALAELLARRYAADPSDTKLKNDLANISLLRKSGLPEAYRMSREVYNSATNNPYFASTYAYALLLQDKPHEAARVFDGISTNFLQIPAVAAYYGVVQARSGHKDLAREPLTIAAKAPLLPEEKEMVRLAQNQL